MKPDGLASLVRRGLEDLCNVRNHSVPSTDSDVCLMKVVKFTEYSVYLFQEREPLF